MRLKCASNNCVQQLIFKRTNGPSGVNIVVDQDANSLFASDKFVCRNLGHSVKFPRAVKSSQPNVVFTQSSYQLSANTPTSERQKQLSPSKEICSKSKSFRNNNNASELH